MSRKYISNTNFYEYDNGVLKNKLNIQNQEEFDKAENDLVSLRITRYIKNNFELTKFDLNDLCGIHKFLFQTIYDWAGEIRKVDISKGSTRFANMQYIDSSWNEYVNPKINEFLNTDSSLNKLAEILGEINLIHPFREGNGRSVRIFITKLASKKNIELDFNVPTEVENLNASIASVNGNIKPLIELLNKCIVK